MRLSGDLGGDVTGRAVRAALWLGIVQAEHAGWDDFAAALYDLHARADQRVRAGEYDRWRARLDVEGPSKPEPTEP
jgi:hypothetical protein